MKIITINLPLDYLKAIQTLNDAGMYGSRSEAIRTALKEFLGDEIQFYKNLEGDHLRTLLRGAVH